VAYDDHRVQAIRRGRQPEPDDRAARYLIDELEKCCLRDPAADSLGTRYDTLMTALEAVCERQDINFSPRYPSLRAWGRSHDLSSEPTFARRTVARGQFLPVLDALDGVADDELSHMLDDTDMESWPAISTALLGIRADYAVAQTVKEYKSLAIQCRDIFVELAELAYEEERHGPLPQPPAGAGHGDVKRRLEAVIRTEAAGHDEEEMRSLTAKSLNLANKLQHRRRIARWQVASMIDATVLTVALVRRLVQHEP
jgi:hypothetical protein